MCVVSLALIFTRSVGTLHATHEAVRPSGFEVQLTEWSQLIISKLSRKSAIWPLRSPTIAIVLVRSLRSARLNTAWLVKSMTYCNDPSGQKCSKTWDGYSGESWFVGEGGDLKFWCDVPKFSLFHNPISVAPRAVKQSNSSSNVNMLVFSNTWGNMCKYLYISV